MAKAKKENYTELSTNDLVAKLSEDRLKYTKTKFNHTISPLDNPLQLKGMRRDVARLITEVNKRKAAEKANTTK